MATATKAPARLLTGTVVRAGHVPRCARVLHKHITYHKYLRKNFPARTTYLVSDPTSSLRDGDIIQFRSGWRVGAQIHHVVERILAPFGTAVEERPAIMSAEEREAWMRARREGKRLRRGEEAEPRMGKRKEIIFGRLLRMEGEKLEKADRAAAAEKEGSVQEGRIEEIGEKMKDVRL
jgi:ribosomal protein S17